MKRRLGFTLVEMVIVIAVIGILATVLVPTFGAIIDKANRSTDVQTAGNLTTLIAMYGAEHKIESEADIAAAINEGKGDENFYQNLKAKSAKQGNSFWYECSTGQVQVGTAADMIERAENQAEPATMGPAGQAETNTFGFRGAIVPGYVLLGADKNGSDLMKLVYNLENAADVGAYGIALEAINDVDTSKAGMQNLLDAANSTVIHNADGAFAPNGTVTNVHIPVLKSEDEEGATLSNSVFVSGVLSNVNVVLPVGTTVTGGSLGYLDSSCTLKVSVPAEELINTIEPSATGAKIVVANGDTYKQGTQIIRDEVTKEATKLINGFTNEITGETVGEEITDKAILATLLHHFDLMDADGNAYIWVDPDNPIIYFSTDMRTKAAAALKSFRLEAFNFLDKNNATGAACGLFEWKLFDQNDNEIPVDTNSKSIIIDPAVVKYVKVSTLGLDYTYEVREVKVTDVEIASINGIKITRNVSFDGGHYAWSLETKIWLTDDLDEREGFKIKLDKSITEFSDSENLFTITPDSKDLDAIIASNPEVGYITGVASISVDSSLKNDRFSKIQVSCSGKASSAQTINLIDARNAAFDINTEADTQKAYGFNYVVGTKGYEIKLQDLFTKKADAIVAGEIVLSKNGETTWKTITVETGWENIVLNDYLAELDTSTLYIKVDGGKYSVPLYLDVKVNAYNVADKEDWKKATTSNGIVVLKGFTIDDTKGKNNSESTTAAEKYVKNLGAASLYGNFKRIDVNFFEMYKAAINCFINVSGGSVERLILVGPDYGDRVSITGDMTVGGMQVGDAPNKGTHVAAIIAKDGAKISHSFISGFRAPVTANGGIVEISDTTLNRGNYANIDVAHATTLNLTDVTTIQYYGVDNNIGAGIAYKYNSGTTHSLTAIDLTQYNYYTVADIRKICNAAANVVPVVDVRIPLEEDTHFGDLTGVKHKINNTEYYHGGIIEIGLTVDAAGISRSGTPAVTTSVQNYVEDKLVNVYEECEQVKTDIEVGIEMGCDQGLYGDSGDVFVTITALKSCGAKLDDCKDMLPYNKDNFAQNLSDFLAPYVKSPAPAQPAN